jgi:hypothetical protein
VRTIDVTARLFDRDSVPERALELRERLRSVRRDWSFGRHDGYPRCCIAHYCWDSWWQRPPAIQRTYELWPLRASGADYVPCGIAHAGGSELGLPARLSRIV